MAMTRLTLTLVGAVVVAALTSVGALAHGPRPSPHQMMGPQTTFQGTQLRIIHVQRGCHVWTNGKRQASRVRMTFHRNARLTILNLDLDGHKLIQKAGPALRLGGTMMMNHRASLVFRKAGVYKFVTQSVEMPGMPEVETTGPDNLLTLTIKVV
jgi:hypothetical protein